MIKSRNNIEWIDFPEREERREQLLKRTIENFPLHNLIWLNHFYGNGTRVLPISMKEELEKQGFVFVNRQEPLDRWCYLDAHFTAPATPDEYTALTGTDEEVAAALLREYRDYAEYLENDMQECEDEIFTRLGTRSLYIYPLRDQLHCMESIPLSFQIELWNKMVAGKDDLVIHQDGDLQPLFFDGKALHEGVCFWIVCKDGSRQDIDPFAFIDHKWLTIHYALNGKGLQWQFAPN